MTNSVATQLSLIAESDFTHQPVGDWEYDQLGTNKFLVPNSPNSELGTNIFLVPNSHNPKLGTDIFLVPNSDNWKPPIGCFQQKWIKDHQYWYWRYYDNRGKKASLYLAKDYNKAVVRAISIGIPPNAKQAENTLPQTNPQTSTATSPNIIDIAPTAYPATRAA